MEACIVANLSLWRIMFEVYGTIAMLLGVGDHNVGNYSDPYIQLLSSAKFKAATMCTPQASL